MNELNDNQMVLYLKKTGIPVIVDLGEISEDGEIPIEIQLEDKHKHLLDQALTEVQEVIQLMLKEMAEDLENA